MAVLSGTDGSVTIDASNPIEITQWDLDYGADIDGYYSRSGAGGQQTVKAGTNGTGNMEFMYNDDTPIQSLIGEGDLITLTLLHSSGDSHTGLARIGRFGFGINRDGTGQRVSVSFTTHGLWTLAP